MALAVDSRQQPQHFSAMAYDSMRYQQSPQFTNPWVSAPQSNQTQLYSTALPQPPVSEYNKVQQQQPSVSTAYPSAGQVSSAPALPSDGMGAPRPYGASYSTTAAAPSVPSYPTTSAPQFPSSAAYGFHPNRRTSHTSVAPADFVAAGAVEAPAHAHAHLQNSFVDFPNRLHHASEAERQSFSDALDASRGMVAMSQSDITPRNIYGNQGSSRSSSDSYGFPPAHSAHSSISSASTYPTYYNSSVSEASTGDYGSASESADLPASRTLPRPNALVGGTLPPAPQSMMGQFSTKVSSSSQKKHKCKICEKRFTRPSSLQTHMYSHTGEKPFACDVDGCGRHFSVVSNLRRHRKVHKGEGRDHPSPDEDDEE